MPITVSSQGIRSRAIPGRFNDAENFRVERIGADGQKTIYAYDRNAALVYQKNITAAKTPTRDIVYLAGEIIGWQDTATTTTTGGGTSTIQTKYYAVTDMLGSVTKVLDSSANIVWQSEYTPFGTVAGSQGTLLFDGMFAGQDIDPDTGLTYHWNRWRSEDGSRFISEDPARDGMN